MEKHRTPETPKTSVLAAVSPDLLAGACLKVLHLARGSADWGTWLGLTVPGIGLFG